MCIRFMRERPRGFQLPPCQPLCCAFGKQKGNGHTTVQLPLVVPLHPLLSGSAGWPWRCTTVTVPNMVWSGRYERVWDSRIQKQWPTRGGSADAFPVWETTDTLTRNTIMPVWQLPQCSASSLHPSLVVHPQTMRPWFEAAHPATFHAFLCKQNPCWNPLAGSIHDFE